MKMYLLGLATLPALALTLYVATWAFFRISHALENRWGITVELKINRNTEGISDYTLLRDIWWEKQSGPIFTGLWYREDSPYGSDVDILKITRWIGLGNSNGNSIMVYRLRELEVKAPAPADDSLVVTPGGKALEFAASQRVEIKSK